MIEMQTVTRIHTERVANRPARTAKLALAAGFGMEQLYLRFVCILLLLPAGLLQFYLAETLSK